jgi:probable HAF family extracellular repeat protein
MLEDSVTDKSMILAVVFSGLAITALSAGGSDARDHRADRPRYALVDLGTLGGPNSFVDALTMPLNHRGRVTACAETAAPNPHVANGSPAYRPSPFTLHAAFSRNGALVDLGVLPGGSNSCSMWINSRGWIVGSSENGAIDPFTGYPQVRATLWKNGTVRNLGTFGGPESFAYAINSQGDVTGFAEHAMPDPFVDSVQVFGAAQTRAFLWNGALHDLGTLGGPNSVGFNINDRGQVAGISNTSAVADPTTGSPEVHAFLWDKGTMFDVGTLGGTFSSENNMNNLGQVVGPSTLAGDTAFHPYLWSRGRLTDLGTLGGQDGESRWINDAGEAIGWAALPIPCPGCGRREVHHATLWRRGRIIDLGVAPGDRCSVAEGINSESQVVGASGVCNGAVNAFLWEKGGPMLNLNALIPSGSPLHLTDAVSINERGEITGTGVLPNGDVHAFLLIPCESDREDGEGCERDHKDRR